jgi:beta-carotene 15,15'-dioxygenase
MDITLALAQLRPDHKSPQALINYTFTTVGIILMLIHYFFPSIEIQYSYPVLFVVVLTLGLIHGCLDYEIAKNTDSAVSLPIFTFKYLIQILAVALVWYFSPSLALLIFLACTAWHFGETDFSLFKLAVHPAVITLYGIGMTTWLLGCHLDENINYLYTLGLASPSNTWLISNIQTVTLAVSSLSLLFIFIAAIMSGLYKSITNTGLLLILLVVTWSLPVLLAFTVYFGFWHSLHTLLLIKSSISVSTKGLMSKAMPYLIISIVMTFVMIYFFSLINLGSEVVLVVFISSLTLPHAGVMHGLLLRYRTQG